MSAVVLEEESTSKTNNDNGRRSSNRGERENIKFVRARQVNLFSSNKANQLNGEGGGTTTGNQAARMAAKKKLADSTSSFQIEVETEMQWRSLLRREGLILVDVYAGWAGPCTSMVSILKRVKVEVGDERLWLAIANSDNISDLLIFKDQSEPTWLFVGGGKPVRVIRGSNVPKLVQAIKSEFEHELLCMTGKSRRNLISIDDEVTRRKKAEDEAMRLSKLIREEEPPEDLDNLRSKSSIRLMSNTEAYTVLVIQSFLLETGAVTEIRDALQGDFKIEQERIMNLHEAGARHLFKIPYEILDPNQPEDFGYVEPEQKDDMYSGGDDDIIIEDNPNLEDGEGEMGPDGQRAKSPKEVKNRMIPVPVPEGLEGETLFMLLESVDVRKMQATGKKPSDNSLLQTADDYLQLKVGPVELKDALEHAPYSFHALYGREKYASGVWCPRRYDDRRYVLLNFFPRFVTEILMPPPKKDPKYMIAVYPAEMEADVSKEVDFHRKDILAEGKVKLAPDVAEEMLQSWSTAVAEHADRKKALTKNPVYALSVDKKNSALILALQSLEPLHMSYDSGYGRVESAKVFTNLNIDIANLPDPDVVVEKFIARTLPRVQSVQEVEMEMPEEKRSSSAEGDEAEEERRRSSGSDRKSQEGGEVRRESKKKSEQPGEDEGVEEQGQAHAAEEAHGEHEFEEEDEEEGEP